MSRRASPRAAKPGKRAGSYQRLYAAQYAGTVVIWECSRAGHRFRQDYGRGPVARRMSATGVALFARRYWTREGGGASGTCPTCDRAEGARP